VAEAWRVLEDPTQAASPRGAQPESRPAAGGAPGRPLWPLIAVGTAVALGAAVWLATTGTSGAAVIVNAAHQPPGLPLRTSTLSADGSAGAAAASASSPAIVIVEVNGAVRRPGVYRLPLNARVADAVAAAGGYAAHVDTAAAQGLNLAAKVADGQQIHVPSRGESGTAHTADGGARGGVGTGAPAAGLVDINAATSAQLEALPGIGPATAAKIIAARADKRFATIDELRERKMIGPSTLEKIRGLVVVR
jgi:competence protein ComEA